MKRKGKGERSIPYGSKGGNDLGGKGGRGGKVGPTTLKVRTRKTIGSRRRRKKVLTRGKDVRLRLASTNGRKESIKQTFRNSAGPEKKKDAVGTQWGGGEKRGEKR